MMYDMGKHFEMILYNTIFMTDNYILQHSLCVTGYYLISDNIIQYMKDMTQLQPYQSSVTFLASFLATDENTGEKSVT